MALNIVAGTERRKRAIIRKWLSNQAMFVGNVFIAEDKLYGVLIDHTSSSVSLDVSSNKVVRLDKRTVASGIRDVGPYYAFAGHYSASSRETG